VRPRAPRVAALIAALGLLAVSPAFGGEGKKDGAKPKSLSQTLTGAAKADFEAAKLLANDGDFVGALIKFQSAYQASKDPRILWNVAFCHKNLRHYAKVTEILKRYISEGDKLLSTADKKDAQDLIAMIEPFTTRATFNVNEAGAQIFIDDELVGASPLAAPVMLDIGERRVRVVKEGFVPFEKSIVVAGGPALTIEVALDKEVHEGKLVIDAPAGAAVYVDDKQIGVGHVEQKIASGGHQLRVVAPGMRPYQTEVIVQDKETRSLNVLLEAIATTERPLPTLRLAVGCADPEPKGPEDGLVVNVDGPEVLPPATVKRRWNDEAGRNVVEFAEYAIAPGSHKLRVSIAECRSLNLGVDVDPVKGAEVRGALTSDHSVLLRGPEGTPGFLRAGLGLWLTTGGAKDNVPEQYKSNGLSVTGAALDLGLVWRWYGLFLDASYGNGSFARQTFNTHYALPSSASVTWDRMLVRTGLRFPFNLVSLGLGPLLGLQEVDLADVRTGEKSGIVGGYLELDVQPVCDWGLSATETLEKPTNDDPPSFGLQIGVFWGPNPHCRRERATAIGLTQAK
jgi:hypothetical protein